MTRLLACCAAIVALAGCGQRREGPGRLVVASVRQPATALFFAAVDTGCLSAEGLAVDERPFDLGRDALALLREGGADVAVAYETPLVRAALADGRLRVLSTLHTSTEHTRLVTRDAAGIRGFADLRGKRVALPRGTNAEFFAEVALAAGGLPRAAVTLQDRSPPEAVAALRRGEVDAAVLFDPYAGQAEEALGPASRTLVTNLYAEFSLVITRADVLASREAALRALVRGLVCAERKARERAGEVRAVVLARFPEQHPGTIDAQLARVRWGVGLENVLVDVLRRERGWLLAATPGAGSVDLNALLEPRLLEEVDPESVTLLPGAGGLLW